MLHLPLVHTIQVTLKSCTIAELDELSQLINSARAALTDGGIHLNVEELSMAQNDRIRGIKKLRDRTGLGLKEAKDLFDLEAPWNRGITTW